MNHLKIFILSFELVISDEWNVFFLHFCVWLKFCMMDGLACRPNWKNAVSHCFIPVAKIIIIFFFVFEPTIKSWHKIGTGPIYIYIYIFSLSVAFALDINKCNGNWKWASKMEPQINKQTSKQAIEPNKRLNEHKYKRTTERIGRSIIRDVFSIRPKKRL